MTHALVASVYGDRALGCDRRAVMCESPGPGERKGDGGGSGSWAATARRRFAGAVPS